MSASVTTLTIPGTGSISAGAALPAPGVYGIEVDGPWTPAPLSILVSQDGQQTWLNAGLEGNEIVLPIAAGQRIQFDSDLWAGVTAIKVRSGSSVSPVPQNADARILVISPTGMTPFPPVEPNPRRTLTPECVGFVGNFAPYWSTTDDVATFDLTFLLADGEVPETIEEFSLTPEGNCPDVTDPDPDARIVGVATITGNEISQRFGNWQPNVVQIIYRVNLVCLTSFGNTISVYAFVVVNQPPAPC